MTISSVEQLKETLQSIVDGNVAKIEQPLLLDNKQLVVYNVQTKRYFCGFSGEVKPKWTPDLLKAYQFPHPAEHNVELKMNLRMLANVGVDMKKLKNLVFSYSVSNESIDVGSIEKRDFGKKADLDTF